MAQKIRGYPFGQSACVTQSVATEVHACNDMKNISLKYAIDYIYD